MSRLTIRFTYLVFLTQLAAATKGLRRTELNFRGPSSNHVDARIPAKIEFCTSEPRCTHRAQILRTEMLILLFFAVCGLAANADDWPMWRYDAGRTAAAPAALPDQLHLQWVRQLPPLEPAYQNPRLQFDAGYEPVVLGKLMFVGSSRNDSVMALDTDTGAERWRFYTNGPVRLAPVAWRDRVYFGSDDGCLYCVAADQGRLLWKFQAVPAERKLLGNGRLISVWPIRGGPVLADGKLYFAAGVLPAEGIFLYALDAESGKVIWRNDRTGYLYGTHPHAAEALGGLTPQGYLAIHRGQLIVPCGSALPARVDLATGELRSFSLPKDGRVPGGWFTAAGKAQRRGESAGDERTLLVYDSQVNRDRHEGGWHSGPGTSGERSTITVGDKTWKFGDGFPGVRGTIHSMLAADGKLFVVTLEGEIYSFGASPTEPKSHALRRSAARAATRCRDHCRANAASGRRPRGLRRGLGREGRQARRVARPPIANDGHRGRSGRSAHPAAAAAMG